MRQTWETAFYEIFAREYSNRILLFEMIEQTTANKWYQRTPISLVGTGKIKFNVDKVGLNYLIISSHFPVTFTLRVKCGTFYASH